MRKRGAFTLIELVLSLSILSIIIVAAGSSMMVMFKAAENNRNLMSDGATGAASGTAQSAAARSAVDLLCSDLKVATAIVSTPAGTGGFQLALTVPPRYAGDSSETLIYQWNGPGNALTRQLNANAPVSVADNVQILNLATISKTVGTSGAGGGP
jgi:prepilin-type N-terminal cleavage/methylation domain-containing protein